MPKESRKCYPNGTNWRAKFEESEAFLWKAQRKNKLLQAEVERLKDENISKPPEIFILEAFKEAHSKEFYNFDETNLRDDPGRKKVQ